MSTQPHHEPSCANTEGTIELEIEPHERDLGGFSVRRVLPASERRMVGPFIFFDEMGPAAFPPGQGMDVRPHPHIGLATLTYLFEGEIRHRDSLGYDQMIQAGAVNLMTAGRGIVHSERAGPDRASTSHLHGIQSWMALPSELEEAAPEFAHYPADALPAIAIAGGEVRVILGSAYGAASPVKTYSPTVYLDVRLSAGAQLTLPAEYSELAAYVVGGRVRIDGREHARGIMLVAHSGRAMQAAALEASRLIVVGGEPVGPRHIWWNFVASSKARIEQAKEEWRRGGFERIAGDEEFIPLPEDA
jgi:redox-sensitive bicupin YhaK (pirin superfamily)